MLATTTYLLTAAHRVHRAALGPRLAAVGLHPGAELALAEIGRNEGLTLSELAGRLVVKPPSVTKLLRTLERAGLAERLADPDDGRIARVYLTRAGRRTLRAAEREWDGAERELLAHLSAAERAALHRLLERAVGAHPGRRA
jgi:DNA-binding MarR family transcriptional regulator